jgi:hypothetical protein
MSMVALPASGTSTLQSPQVTVQLPVAGQAQGAVVLLNDAPQVTAPELDELLDELLVAPVPVPLVLVPVPVTLPVVPDLPDPEQPAAQIVPNSTAAHFV